jgi:RHS repeat-associated protein
VSTQYVYFPDTKRLNTVTTGSRPPPGGFQVLSYTYDLVGNVMTLANGIDRPTPVPPNTVVAPGPSTQSFVYDDLYQLTSASGFYEGCACGCSNDRQYTLTMQYDDLGNITHKTQKDVIEAPAGSGQFTTQMATSYDNPYLYETPGRPHAPSSIGNESLTYDTDGNMQATNGTFGPARTFTWTEDDRLRSEVDSGFTNTYLYDAAGNRTTKRRTSIETWYVNPFYVVKGYSSETKHIMVGDTRIASEMATLPSYTNPTTAGAGTVFYYHPDHLQSTNFTTGSDGSLLQHDEYIATGEVWFQEAKNSDSRNTQPWLFNAKELDETGLYAFGARYYNPKYSIWSSPDPILASYMQRGGVRGGATPANLGLYSYTWNNPINLRDPTGRQTIEPEFEDPRERDENEPFVEPPKLELGEAPPVLGLREGEHVRMLGIENTAMSASPGFEPAYSPPPGPMSTGPGRTPEENEALMSLPDAEARANEIHGLLDPRAARSRTTAVTETKEGTRIVSSSNRRLTPAQRAALRKGEVEGVGPGHAERKGVSAAKKMGLTPTGTAASRPICPECAAAVKAENVRPLSPQKQ